MNTPTTLLQDIFKQLWRTPKQVICCDDFGEHTGFKILAGAYHFSKWAKTKSQASRIGVMLPTSHLFPMALLGIWHAGKTVVPFNYLLEKRALEHCISDSEVDTIWTVKPLLDTLDKGAIPTHINIVCIDENPPKGLPPIGFSHKPAADAEALILYTSGTSGLPKGVQLSHHNLASNVHAAISHANLESSGPFLGVLPNFHAFGVSILTLLPLLIGAKIVYTARFIPRRLIDLIKIHQAEVFVAVPSMYAALAAVKKGTKEDAASLKWTISGAEPLPKAISDAFYERYGKTILEGYGLTEMSPATHWALSADTTPGTVGTCLPGVDTFIVDEDGKTILPSNANGEIFLAGPNLMKGYLKLPEQTAEAVVMLNVPERGNVRCLRTGDIGNINNKGELAITGRKKEMLIVAGENVFPREIEEIVNQHPDVLASGVVGKADDMRGEIPIAFVELQKDASCDDKVIRQFVQQHLPTHKVPREVHILEALPRNATGKILRKELKKLL